SALSNYKWWGAPFYGVGMKIYDLLAGDLGIASSRHLSREETIDRLPTLQPCGLRSGTLYHDAQFDDAQLAITLAQTLVDLGGAPINYMHVSALLKRGEKVCGVHAVNSESGVEHDIGARVV